MVTAKTVKGLAERLIKAEQLVESGAVYPVAGCERYWVVKNGTGDSMYLVRTDAGHEHCSCPDFQQRQKAAGLPCKHLLAAQIVVAGETPQPPAPVAMLPTKIDSALGLVAIMAPAGGAVLPAN